MNRDVAGSVVGNGEVQQAIRVEVGHTHREGKAAGRDERLSTKGAIAIAHDDRHVSFEVVRNCQIQLAIAIEISDCDPVGTKAWSQMGLRRKVALPISEQDGHITSQPQAEVGGYDVGVAVTVQVCSRDKVWRRANRVDRVRKKIDS